MPVRRLLALSTVLALTGAPAAAVAGPAAPVPAAGASGDPAAGYLVVRRDDAATTPGAVTAAERVARGAALDRIAGSVGARPVARTTTVLSTFTAPLTPAQAQALRRSPEVASVTPVRRHRLTSVGTPEALGLTGTAPGSWASFGGRAAAGRGVVVGVVDSGVWPESPAFAGAPLATGATSAPGLAYRTATGTAMRRADGGTFTGSCSGQAGARPVQQWSPALCNQTLISARAFPPSGPLDLAGPTDPRGRDFASPRDGLGHGTHTSSTAVGRPVQAALPGANLATSTGVAPGAALASYKACWTSRTDEDRDGLWDNWCTDDSLIAAIDRAVADGVDVLSFSISGTTNDPLDPLSLAMLGAARAGVLVVASAGNDGNRAGTVNHPVPWVMTVGNATWRGEGTVDWWSGRGPTPVLGGAVLKPDVVAPGTDVVSSVPPPVGAPANRPAVESMSGASMATPHVAGLAALLLGRSPRLSPMQLRTAISTTARPLAWTSPFAQGSGTVSATTMVDAPLLLDAGGNDYLAVARWAGLPGAGRRMDPVDLAQPSIVLPDVTARRTALRVFTATRTGVWSVRAQLPGYSVEVTPRRALVTHVGQQVRVTVTVRRTSAERGAFAAGTLTLGGTSSVQRLPLLARTR